MIRPPNCASRWLWSLWMVAIGTRTLDAVTVLPLTTRLPVTWLVRPTAMLFWPRRTSFTRYPARDPAATCQVPPSDAAVVPACPAGDAWAADGLAVVGPRLSGAGAGPSMKWM